MKFRNLLFLLLIFLSASSIAQIDYFGGLDDINYKAPREYVIAEVKVEGVDNLDKNVITLLAGLNVGARIEVPGEEIQRAVENLWKQDLFSDIQIIATKVEGDRIYLSIYLQELPRLSKYAIRGVKKSQIDDIRELLKIERGDVVNQNLIVSSQNKIRDFFVEKGNLNADVRVVQKPDTALDNSLILIYNIDAGPKVKVNDIIFTGNEQLSDKDLRKAMKNTKRKGWNFFKSSKFIREEYQEDLQNVIGLYNVSGYRDMRIISDTVYDFDEETVNIEIHIEEGNKYYFRNISWLGNQKYTDETLSTLLAIEKGDVFDISRLESRLYMSMEGTDISSLYMDEGYLFFDAQPVEIYATEDSIDIEIRIREGQQARINKITISGNTRTNDHVVLRELYTKPGELFSRSDVQRSIRQLSQLGFFDPEQIGVNPVPNPETGSVDIEYTLVERSTSQIELQGGWGGNRLVGTFGVVFDNFAAENVFKKGGWNPLPQGNGQRLSLRAQSAGRSFQSYNASFTEPWLGGKKPNSLTVSLFSSIQSNGLERTDENRQTIAISGVTVGLGQRLQWPDDYFTLFQSLNFNHYQLFNQQQFQSVFGYTDGTSQAFSYRITFGRNSIDNPIYPRSGSNISVTLQATPPLSLLSDKDYENLEPEEKYEWIEYHKWKFDAKWYTRVFDDLVFKVGTEFGFLAQYNDAYGYSPFERFYVGGDGLQGFVLDGREVIGLRGYGNQRLTDQDGGVIYNKLTLEMRYPVSLNPSATIYLLSFLEGGNSWNSFDEYNPFEIKRSAGVGVRIFMPMFGTLGVDFGYGFDSPVNSAATSGWQTHFILGQQF
jgi:outer membrane protein insertion porin family